VSIRAEFRSTIPLVPTGTGFTAGSFHMTIDRRALAGALATLLLVAACGGSSSPAPSSAPGASATPAASQEPAASEAAQETPSASEGPDISLAPGAAGDLEAKLPSEVNGVRFTKTSFDGNSFPAGVPIGDTEMEQLLKDSGKSLQDVRVAIATPADTAAATAGNVVMALQIKGVDSATLESWATGQLGDSSATKTTVGGKQVYGSSAAGVGGAYFYVKDDVLYYVISFGTSNLAEGIFQQLP
jgi:hypothetical protein